MRTFPQKKTSGISGREPFPGRKWESRINIFNWEVSNALFLQYGDAGNCIFSQKLELDTSIPFPIYDFSSISLLVGTSAYPLAPKPMPPIPYESRFFHHQNSKLVIFIFDH